MGGVERLGLIACVVLLGTGASDFEDPPRFGPGGTTLDAEIERLAGKAPDAAAAARQAEALTEADDMAGALALYESIHEDVPWWATGLQRRCELHLALEQRSDALLQCRAAWTVRETPGIALSFAAALSSGTVTDRPTSTDLAEADALLADVLLQRPDDAVAATLRCRVAEQRKDLRRLRRCAGLLVDHAPEQPTTWYYALLVHVADKRWVAAQDALRRAEATGLDPAEVARLRSELLDVEPTHIKWGGNVQFASMLWLLSGLFLVLIGLMLSTATRVQAERLATSPLDRPARVSGLLRLLYRGVLTVTCAWYWISMPVALVGVGAAMAAGFYVLLLDGLPAGFAWSVLGIGVVVVGFLAARLLVEVPPADASDFELARDAHPQLWALLHEVAERVGTPAVDRVLLTPGDDIAVWEERGVGRAMVGGRGRRCLELGFGALMGMDVGQLRAILAHEYGHFAHGDTAGGAFALGVRRSLTELGQALMATGLARMWNPLTWLLVGFWRLFQLISQGLSRLQEVEADRIAIRLAGSDTFARSLDEVTRGGLWFRMNLSALVRQSVEERTRLPDIFRTQPTGRYRVDPSDYEAALEAQRARSGDLWDSHPPTRDRLRWAKAHAAPGTPAWNDAAPCAALFSDLPALERTLNERVRRNLLAWIDAMARC